ncbi:hypothetical protein [Streptomyces sp. NPDC059168]|uniref:hypothetical protein n=1 Tax=Streptomyces sp. NPDC059168 TaxID=3346753 RepID=UPI003674A79C
MANLMRGAAALLCVSVAGLIAGCSKSQPAIPEEFCRVPVKKSALEPLIPNGDSVNQKYRENEAQTGASCTLHVDSHQVLFVEMVRWDRLPESVNWSKVGSPYKHAAKREVSFPGHASIGSENAIVQATCDKRTAYMTFDMYLRGDRVDDTPKGYKKLQSFVNDFVPRETKKFGCTK